MGSLKFGYTCNTLCFVQQACWVWRWMPHTRLLDQDALLLPWQHLESLEVDLVAGEKGCFQTWIQVLGQVVLAHMELMNVRRFLHPRLLCWKGVTQEPWCPPWRWRTSGVKPVAPGWYRCPSRVAPHVLFRGSLKSQLRMPKPFYVYKKNDVGMTWKIWTFELKWKSWKSTRFYIFSLVGFPSFHRYVSIYGVKMMIQKGQHHFLDGG